MNESRLKQKPIIIALSALLLVGFLLYIALAVWTKTIINPRFPSDIQIYLDAAQKILLGKNPYRNFQIGSSFVYPPPAFLLFIPLSQLTGAPLLWEALSIVCLLTSMNALWLAVRPRMTGLLIIWFMATVILFAPFLETLSVGQVNCLVLLGITLFILGVTHKEFRWIGDLGLAFGIAIKITPLLLVAYPLLTRDWHRCGRIAIGLGALIGASLLFFGVGPWIGFSQILPELFIGYPHSINLAITPSLQWLFARSALPLTASGIGTFFSFGVLLAWITLVFLYRNNKDQSLALLCLGVVVMTISSSLIWYHHLVFLILPLAYLLVSRSELSTWNIILITLAIASLGLIQSDRWFEYKLHIPPFPAILGYLLVFLASLLKLLSSSNQLKTE